jgi:hypothetical protein
LRGGIEVDSQRVDARREGIGHAERACVAAVDGAKPRLR